MMGRHKDALFASDERIVDQITAIFEMQETLGVNYTFGKLMATNKKLILYTKYPLFTRKEITFYHYNDITCINVSKSLFSFTNGVSMRVKLVNKGDANLLLEIIRTFSDHVSIIGSSLQKSPGT